MSRDKSVWFAEEILLDAKLINWQLEAGEWDAVQDMLRAEAQLSRDADTGRLRPKKASEYTLRLIAEVLHIMQLDVEQGSYNRSTLAVAEQCLRLVRSCAAAGTKMQTYISKDISILDSMLTLSAEFQQPGVAQSEETAQQYERCMVVLVQTLGNLVVNNPFNQIIVWDKFDSIILNSLVGPNEQIASAAAMVVYNILLGQPNVLPDDVLLLNSLAYMYANGNTEYPDLIIEYLIGVENTYIEKLYAKLDPECRMLVLSLAYNILMSNEMQDINVSVNFVRFMAHEFKARSDLVLKTVDKYVADAEPREVVCLLDVLAAASCMDAYRDALQADTSLFINCAFLLRAIHKLGKESDNFFTSLNKLYEGAGRTLVTDPLPEPFLEHSVQPPPPPPTTHQLTSLSKSASSENVACAESASECTESESSEHYYECADTDVTALPAAAPSPPAAAATCAALGSARNIDHDLLKVAFVKNINESDESRLPPSRKISLEHKIDIEEGEPPLILDASSPHDLKAIAEVVGARVASSDGEEAEATEALRTEAVRTETETAESSPDEPVTEIAAPEPQKEVKRSQNLSTDFNLSEQLERILGTGERRAEHPPAPSATAAAPSPATTAPPAAPTVHIDSPDSHRNRLGAIDMSTPKRVVTSVHSVEQHVAFGFKATLVRVLANLCWKHPINKRHMRELEVIPVLLDCCNIDARNPLIMQWVIFAIRNLCENCPENQEVISQLTLRAPLQSDLLQEMGLALHTDASGRSLRVAPLPN